MCHNNIRILHWRKRALEAEEALGYAEVLLKNQRQNLHNHVHSNDGREANLARLLRQANPAGAAGAAAFVPAGAGYDRLQGNVPGWGVRPSTRVKNIMQGMKGLSPPQAQRALEDIGFRSPREALRSLAGELGIKARVGSRKSSRVTRKAGATKFTDQLGFGASSNRGMAIVGSKKEIYVFFKFVLSSVKSSSKTKLSSTTDHLCVR